MTIVFQVDHWSDVQKRTIQTKRIGPDPETSVADQMKKLYRTAYSNQLWTVLRIDGNKRLMSLGESLFPSVYERVWHGITARAMHKKEIAEFLVNFAYLWDDTTCHKHAELCRVTINKTRIRRR